jgi:hypothetical protein
MKRYVVLAYAQMYMLLAVEYNSNLKLRAFQLEGHGDILGSYYIVGTPWRVLNFDSVGTGQPSYLPPLSNLTKTTTKLFDT